MTPGRKRWLLRMAVVVAVALVFLVWKGPGQQSKLVVANRSGQSIGRLRLTVAGQTETLHDVPKGAERPLPFGIKAGDDFAVEGELKDGTMIRGGGKAGEGTRLVIQPGGGIEFPPPGRNEPR